MATSLLVTAHFLRLGAICFNAFLLGACRPRQLHNLSTRVLYRIKTLFLKTYNITFCRACRARLEK